MPLRSVILSRRWATVDLPILPFLAPRVFTPWPWSGRRAQSSTAAAQDVSRSDRLVDMEIELEAGNELSYPGASNRKPRSNLLEPQQTRDPYSFQQDAAVDLSSLNISSRASGEECDLAENPSMTVHESNHKNRAGTGLHNHSVLGEGQELKNALAPRELQSNSLTSRPDSFEAKPSKRQNQETILNRHPFTAKPSGLSPNNWPRGLALSPRVTRSWWRDSNSEINGNPKINNWEVAQNRIHQKMTGKRKSLRGQPVSYLQPTQSLSLREIVSDLKGQRLHKTYKTRHSSGIKNSRLSLSGIIARYLHLRKLNRRPPVCNYIHWTSRTKFFEPPKEFLYWRRKGTRGIPTLLLHWWRALPKNLKLASNLPVSPSDMVSFYGHQGFKPLFGQFSASINHIVHVVLNFGPVISSTLDRRYPEEEIKFLPAYKDLEIESTLEVENLPAPLLHDQGHAVDMKHRQEIASTLLRPILFILRRLSHLCAGSQKQFLTGPSIYRLTQNLDINSLKLFYRTLIELDCRVQIVSWSYFADRFAREGESDLAIDVMRVIHNLGGDINLYGCDKVCSVILQSRHRSNTLLSDTEVLKILLNCGLRLNTIHYNILLHNSVITGDHSSGWHIYEMMLQNKIDTDSHTYSILLNIAKKRMDVASIQRVMRLVGDLEIRSDHIATDHLDIVFRLYKQEQRRSGILISTNPTAAFDLILPVYVQYFSLDSLLIAIPSSKDAVHRLGVESHIAERIQPPASTMSIMFSALLHDITDPAQLKPLYEHFRTVSRGDNTGGSAILRCLDDRRIYNSFLMAFGKFPSTLHLCPAVVEDMIKTPAVRRTNVQEIGPYRQLVDPDQPYRPTPDIFTWTILLAIYIRHRQTHAAEKVLDLMTARGIEPTQFTYMQLVYGYSNMQDVEKTVYAIERLRLAPKSDLHTDPVVWSVSKLHNRRRFVEIMKTVEARSTIETADPSPNLSSPSGLTPRSSESNDYQTPDFSCREDVK